MVKNNLVLLSYGKQTEYNRAIFCVLSFLAWSDDSINDIRILIYTDNPGYFKDYLKAPNIEYVHLTPSMLEDMLGNTGFFHRRKIAIIDMTFKNFPDSNLLFVDSDTFFITQHSGLINGFAPGKSFMHKREYSLKEGLSLFSSFNQAEYPIAFLDYLSGRSFLINGKPEIFDENDYSWNAGVLGLNKEFAIYMKNVFQLCDELFANSKWFICEQMAFSLVLQRKTNIYPSEQFVLHYWGKRQKVLLDLLIEKLLRNKSTEQLSDQSLIKLLTKKWTKKVAIDLIEEQIEIAYSQRHLWYGIKKSVSLIAQNPFRPGVYKFVSDALISYPKAYNVS